MSNSVSFIHLTRAALILHAGGVIAYPTEAVYGIGCLPYADDALARIMRIKRRSPAKGLILIAADIGQAAEYAVIPGGEMGERLRADWPGPVTWILPAHGHVADSITGGRRSVAIRVTDHPIAGALCAAAGSALVSTSANLSGREPIRHKTQLRHQLGRSLDMIMPGSPGNRSKPTAIRDGSTGAVIRAD